MRNSEMPDGNIVGYLTTTHHTDEHHGEHGGVSAQSWINHTHDILKHPIANHQEVLGKLGEYTVYYKTIKYIGVEFSPQARRVYNLGVNIVRRMARR